MLCWKQLCKWPILGFLCLLFFMTMVQHVSSFTCPSNQTAELGKEGRISLNSTDDIYEVDWYDNLHTSGPLIKYSKHSQEKSGPGFENKTVDVLEDGTLEILKVTVEHERTYKVIIFTSAENFFSPCYVSLRVIVYPGDGFPALECKECLKHYYHLKEGNKAFTCSVNMSRPAVQLQWVEQFFNKTKLLKPIPKVVENKDGTFNASLTIQYRSTTDRLISVLFCKAKWDLGQWRREIPLLLDFSHCESFASLARHTLYIEENRKAELRCEGLSPVPKLWKKIIEPGKEPETIGFVTGGVTRTLTKLPDTKTSLEGSLILSQPKIDHEGLYACLHGNEYGKKDEIILKDVVVLVPPTPPFIQIEGCDNTKWPCEVSEKENNQLTCAIHGVRPNVSLQWIAKSPHQVSLTPFNSTNRTRSHTFDVELSVKYDVSGGEFSDEEVLIECCVSGPVVNIIKASVPVRIIPKPRKENFNWKWCSEILQWLAVPAVLAVVIWAYVHTQRTLTRVEARLLQADRINLVGLLPNENVFNNQ